METLQDLTISPDRLRGDPKAIMTDGEVAVCRASLGALQWVATQTQLQACARVNLLLTELTVNRNIMVAKEIQSLIKEIRSEPVTLKMWRIPEIQHWQDAVIVTLADQAHANRPQGGSTGGYITFIGGPQHAQGEAGRLNILSWRSWRLKRKAISTNDGEIQSMVEGEDANFRTRFLWCQLNGCILKEELLDEANDMVTYVRGILGTDSRGGFDAIMKNESPLLGLSNIRSALQALPVAWADRDSQDNFDLAVWRLEPFRCPDQEGQDRSRWIDAVSKKLDVEAFLRSQFHPVWEEVKTTWTRHSDPDAPTPILGSMDFHGRFGELFRCMNGWEDFGSMQLIHRSAIHSMTCFIACLPQALSPGTCDVKHCHSCFGVLLHLPRCVALGILLAVHHLWHPIPIGAPA